MKKNILHFLSGYCLRKIFPKHKNIIASPLDLLSAKNG